MGLMGNSFFGKCIINEDNKNTSHYEVAACALFLSEQDVQVAACVEKRWLLQNPPGYTLSNHHQNMLAASPSNAFNFSCQGPTIAGQWRLP